MGRFERNQRGLVQTARRGLVGTTLLLLPALTGCGSFQPDQASEPERNGLLRLALLTETNGTVYRLSGTFLVFDGSADAGVVPVATVATANTSNARALSLELPEGRYLVLLQDDWRLEVTNDGGATEVAARLTGDNPIPVDISRHTSAVARFQFDIIAPGREDSGELLIDFDVNETAVCGNGVVEAQEACDDGAANGLVDRCDTSCRFECAGACPVRVDPAAEPTGSGRSWVDPMADLQAALDQQASLGGGSVWVLGGAFDALFSNSATLATLPSDVALYGGFDGTEWDPKQRAPSAPRTLFTRDTHEQADPLIVVDGQSGVLLDGIGVRDALGGSSVTVMDSQNVVLNDVQLECGALSGGTCLEIASSGARLQGSFIHLGGTSLTVGESDVALVDTMLEGSYPAPFVSARASRLLYERVDASIGTNLSEDSHLLVKDSILRETTPRHGLVNSFGDPSQITFVDSVAFDTSVSLTAIEAQSVFVWNSSFVRLSGTRSGGGYARARAIEGVRVEVAMSTFYDNYCDPVDGECVYEVLIGETGFVHNSVFVNEYEPPYVAAEDPAELAVSPNGATSGNCSTYDLDTFVAPSDPWAPVLAVDHPCRDGGDEAALEAARQRLLELAAPFAEAPFHAELTRYESPDWWRTQSVLADECSDQEAPDPGRHYAAPCPEQE